MKKYRFSNFFIKGLKKNAETAFSHKIICISAIFFIKELKKNAKTAFFS
jgi:hypothetical protein